MCGNHVDIVRPERRTDDMSESIRLQIGEDAGRGFVEFWTRQAQTGKVPIDVECRYVSSSPPRQGMGLGAPAEVVLALAKGTAGAIGAV